MSGLLASSMLPMRAATGVNGPSSGYPATIALLPILAWAAKLSGAAALLRRGGQRVAGYADGPPPHAVEAAQVARFAAELADLIERDGLAAATPDDLRVSLRGV